MNQTAQANRRENQFALRRVGEVCELLNGLAFKPEEWSAAGIPIIRIQNLNGAHEFNFYEGFISEDYVIKPGTLLFAWLGNRGTSFGPFVWRGPTGVLNQHIFKVTPKAGIDGNWLHHALQIARERAERQAHGGSGLVHVRREDLLSFRIPTADANEQSRIAAVLDTVDEAIAKTKAVIAKLRQVRTGLLHDLLTRGLDEHGLLRDPITHPEQFQNSLLGQLPRSWHLCWLGDVLQSPPRNGYSPREGQAFSGSYLLGLSCLTSEGFAPLQLKNAPSNDSQLAAFLLRDGDLLISRSNTRDLVGLPGVFRNVSYPCYYPDLMMRLIPKAELITEFLELLLRHSRSRSMLVATASGTSASMVKITGTNVMGTPIAYPDLDEQQRILTTLAPFDEELKTLYTEHLKLTMLKSGLMSDLLTGRVRVPEAISVVENQS